MIENPNLLNKLMVDGYKSSKLYQPGKYWKKKNIQAHKEILKKGIKNFRGADNNIGASFSDNQNINILNDYFGGFRGFFKFLLEKVYPLKNIFIRQVSLTSGFRKELNLYKSKYFENSNYFKELSKMFIYDNTVNCGCEDYSITNEKKISNYYLTIADTHLNFSKNIDFNKINSFFEIGGGFGANVHFLLQNYPNIKKIIYLDLPVNLYIATQYLRSFYGNSVKDYLTTHNKKVIFEDNNNLEIICIPPWKITDLDVSIDYFQNSNSFVEMPENIIRNYCLYIKKCTHKKTRIALSSYGSFKSETTFDPKLLKEYFDFDLDVISYPSTVPNKKDNIFFISK